jgi:large subunit ribosomal protein L21
VPKPDASLTAVVVSGGKQYRVAPGDHILVDRLSADPGTSIKLGRVLLVSDAGKVTVGMPGVEGVEVEAKVLAHRRGPRIDVLRYKSKKRVRVHRGARADLTAIEILSVGGEKAEVKAQAKAADEAGDEQAATPETAVAPKRAARKPRAPKVSTETTEVTK